MQEEGVLKGQELENAVVDADYSKAIQIAFELRRPHKLFELFAGLCRSASFCASLLDVYENCCQISQSSTLQEERS